MLFIALQKKIKLMRGIRTAYATQDKEAMKRVLEQQFPMAIKAYNVLMNLHRSFWETTSKRQGWEVLALRYGGAVGRMSDVQDEIERWMNGDLNCIPELDEPALPDGKGFTYDRTSTPSAKT